MHVWQIEWNKYRILWGWNILSISCGINASSLYLLWNEDVLQPQYIIDEALFYFVVNCLIRDCILNPWFLSVLMIAHQMHSALLVCLSSHRSMKNEGGGWRCRLRGPTWPLSRAPDPATGDAVWHCACEWIWWLIENVCK